MLFIAIYNDQWKVSRRWTRLFKKFYKFGPRSQCEAFVCSGVLRCVVRGDVGSKISCKLEASFESWRSAGHVGVHVGLAGCRGLGRGFLPL